MTLSLQNLTIRARKFICVSVLTFFVSIITAHAQTNYSYSISAILNAMPNGLRLADGTIAKAKLITTSTATFGANHGDVGPFLGGMFDNVPPSTNASTTQGNTIIDYTGSKNPLLFTLIQGSSLTVDNGSATNCNASIGFHIWFDRPNNALNFLCVDIDGLETDALNPNAEWITNFAFNGNTFVNTSFFVNTPTTLMQQSSVTVGNLHPWRTMLTNELNATAAANFPTSTYNRIIRKTNNENNLDPDDRRGQVMFDPTGAATDFFVLWGIWGALSTAGTQNSGISPLVVTLTPDFGDAPDSYKTLVQNGGASHGISSAIKLGATINTEADGVPSVNANSHVDDDGVATVPAINNNGVSGQIIPTYSLTTTYNNTTGLPANLVAFIDWNNNGIFEATEAQTATTAAASTNGTVTFTWNNFILSGATGLSKTFARIRITTEAITGADAGGAFKDGEVEDYEVAFATVLPLKLVSFTGNLKNNVSQLTWKSLNESNVLNYDIELSTDGNNFQAIGSVAAQNQAFNTYNFNHTIGSAAVYYFRIKAINQNASIVYSSIITIYTKKSATFNAKVFPSPVTDHLTIYLPFAENATANICDLNGKIIYSVKLTNNTTVVPVNALSKGIYILKIKNSAGESITQRIVKD